MIILSDATLQHLPHYWHKLSSDRKIWFLKKCDCNPILESYWGILKGGEVEIFVKHQTLSPKFICNNWQHFNPLIKLVISQYQTLPEWMLEAMWDSFSHDEKRGFCTALDISREFMIENWYTFPDYMKVEYFTKGEHGKSISKGALPMFLTDSNLEVRQAASKYLNAWIGLRLLWKVTYYLERFECYVIPRRYRGFKIDRRRKRKRT